LHDVNVDVRRRMRYAKYAIVYAEHATGLGGLGQR